MMSEEYKKLLVLEVALNNLEGVYIPIGLIKDSIKPLLDYIELTLKEIEVEA